MKSVKTIILIVAIGIISFNTMAQTADNKVPQAVLTSFSAKYPHAELKKWKANNNTYMARFIMNDKKYEASYSGNGNWLNTKRDIRHIKNLPDQIRMFLKSGSYASWHIDDMERLRTPSQNMYRVEVDNASGNKFTYEDAGSFEDYVLCFNDNGKLIKAVDNDNY